MNRLRFIERAPRTITVEKNGAPWQNMDGILTGKVLGCRWGKAKNCWIWYACNLAMHQRFHSQFFHAQ